MDRELIERVIEGDPDAAGEFVGQCHRYVYGVLYGILRRHTGAVEDVYQQVWIRLWENDFRGLRRWRGEQSFLPYLGTITRRLAIDWLRSHRLPIEPEPEDSPSGRPGPEAGLLDRRLRDAVREALTLLKPRDRQLIELRHFEEMSYKKIASVLGMTVSNVGVSLGRAEERLRGLVQEHYPDFVLQEDARRPAPM